MTNDAGPILALLDAPDMPRPLSVGILGPAGDERTAIRRRVIGGTSGPQADFRAEVGEGAAAGARLRAVVQDVTGAGAPRASTTSPTPKPAGDDDVSVETLFREDGGGADRLGPALESARFLGISDAFDSVKDLVKRVEELRLTFGRWRAYVVGAIRAAVARGIAKLLVILAVAIVALLALQWGHDLLLGEHSGFFADMAGFLTQVVLLIGAAWVGLRRLKKAFDVHVERVEGLREEALDALGRRRQRFAEQALYDADALLAPSGATELRRAVVHIGGLDLCDSTTTRAVLDAMRRVLDGGSPVALVVAADPAALRGALGGSAAADAILEGLLHVTVAAEPLGEDARRRAVAALLDHGGAGRTPADPAGPTAIHRPWTEGEREALLRFAPLVSTRHAIQRWLATYALYRAGLSDAAFAELVDGGGGSGSFREMAFLLAAGCGRPAAASALFAALVGDGGDRVAPRDWVVRSGELDASVVDGLDVRRLGENAAWAKRHTTAWRQG